MFIKGNNLISKDIRNILLIQLGDIGDVVWATPTFRAVKEAYPQAKVSVLLRENFGSLLEKDPHIHSIFEVKRYRGNFVEKMKGQIRFLRALRQERFDLVFDLRLDDRGAFAAFFTSAPIRVSIIHNNIPWRNLLFTHLVDPSPTNERVYGAAEQTLKIVREFNIDSKNTIPKLWVGAKTIERMRYLLNKKGISGIKDCVSINPFSRWRYKEWDYQKWIQSIDWLWKNYRIPAVIVGSAEEIEKAEYIKRQSCGQIFNLAGRTTLGELAGLLSLSWLHIGVDSAATHIAAAVGTPTITIYGPSDWLDWAPLGKAHSVITPDRDCAPCHQKGCDGSGISKCLETLSVDSVKSAVRVFLEKNGIVINRGG